MADGNGVIRTPDQFDFSAHEAFMKSSQDCLADPAIRKIVVNLGQSRFMDSAALGMLIWLKGKCKEKGKDMSISGAQGAARETLDIANIHKMITVE